jgi:hypothetical protein
MHKTIIILVGKTMCTKLIQLVVFLKILLLGALIWDISQMHISISFPGFVCWLDSSRLLADLAQFMLSPSRSFGID